MNKIKKKFKCMSVIKKNVANHCLKIKIKQNKYSESKLIISLVFSLIYKI